MSRKLIKKLGAKLLIVLRPLWVISLLRALLCHLLYGENVDSGETIVQIVSVPLEWRSKYEPAGIRAGTREWA